MLKPKNYRTLDFIIISFKAMPFQTILSILNIIISSLIPAYETIAIANFINTALDIFNGQVGYTSIYLPLGLIALSIIYKNIIPSITNLIDLSGKNKLNTKLKQEIILKRAKLEYKHIENKDTWDLINRVCTDPTQHILDGFNNILNAANLIIRSISLLFIVMSSAFISGIIIILVGIPLFYLAMRTGKKNYQMGIDAKNIQRKYNYLSTILTNREYAEERKLFDYGSTISDKYSALYDESTKIESKIEIKSYANMKSGSMITLLIVIIIAALLLSPLHRGKITIGLFIALINAIYGLVQNMSWQLSTTMRDYAKLKEYLKDLSKFTKLSEKKDANVLPTYKNDFKFHSLEFRNVSFKYPETDKYILKDCSFILTSDKNYAFVGINGAGKTTIIKLLIGMYEDFEGDIFINNKNIREYTFGEIKGLVSVVFQDYAKYALTIKDNISIGDLQKKLDYEKINQIIDKLELKDIVKQMKYGLETYLGKIDDDSQDLSGGQWQKLALSRLLYSSSEINILDEPTAALDPLAESKIYDLFSKINSEKFTIYITHRLGAARMADEILVVDNGHIVEQGSHDYLISYKNGKYRKMFESQKSWYE